LAASWKYGTTSPLILSVIGRPRRSRAAGGDPHPAFAHAVLLDVVAFLSVEADADAA
jgi:hypothetical protein